MKKGQIANIYNQTLSGKTILEGKAKLIKLVNDDPGLPEIWQVEFLEEKGRLYSRAVAEQNIILGLD